MSTIKLAIRAPVALTAAGLPSLASNTYTTSSPYDNTVNKPLDLLLSLSITPGAVSSNKQAVVFAQASLDGIIWQTGATSTADEIGATYVGVLPLPASSTTQVTVIPVALAYGGALPPYIRFVIKNESGATFTAGSLNISEAYSTVD